MENDIPSDGQAVGGDCFYKVCPKSFGQIFSIAPRGEHYIPAIFFISFSLFKASMGVSESMSSPLIWSRI